MAMHVNTRKNERAGAQQKGSVGRRNGRQCTLAAWQAAPTWVTRALDRPPAQRGAKRHSARALPTVPPFAHIKQSSHTDRAAIHSYVLYQAEVIAPARIMSQA